MLPARPVKHLLLLVAWLLAAIQPAAEAGSRPGAEASTQLPAAAGSRHAPPTREERQEILRGVDRTRRDSSSRSPQVALLTPGAPVDVEQYTIDLKVLPQPKRLVGSVRIRARVTSSPVSVLDVGLYDVMTVGSILRGAVTLAYTRAANMLHVTLDRSYAAGELIDIVINYSGTPPTVGYGSFAFLTHGSPAAPIISSLSEPTYAPTWWPCIDDPADKAIVEMNLNVPSGLTGVSNGRLIATVVNGDNTTTFRWASAYPVSTYLVSVAISNYATWTDLYAPVTGGPSMPVQHWVYPEHLAAAQADLAVTVPQLVFFSGLFGEYPFVQEKYGHAIFPFGGGMEHQTVTSYGAGLINGTGSRYWVVAHELAHQWWGDSVTLADWREIWLNEGFATYSEALWYEHLNGHAGLSAYLASLDTRPFCGTLWNTACDMFGHTIYDKGGWVLHMLRHVVGDSSFFLGLRNYASDYALSNATTQDFRAVMESASGRYLGDFFDRWVYQDGEPVYRWGWTAAPTPAGWVTHVRVEQTQGGALFSMPIDLKVNTPSGSFQFTIENDAVNQDFALPPVPARPASVELDPDYWLLKSTVPMTPPDLDVDGVPDTADNCGSIYNPAQDDLDADTLGNPCDADMDGDGAVNTVDCAPLEPAVQALPGETTNLVVSGGSVASLAWDPGVPAGSVTEWDLLRGDAGALAPLGGAGGEICLAPRLPAAATIDTQSPAPAGIFYYLVRPRNICGPGPLGVDSSGTPRQSPACP